MQKINYGCSWSGEELVVVQFSENLENSVELANEIKKAIQQVNRKRQFNGNCKIAYKIATSPCLDKQFEDVANGQFKFVDDEDAVQEKEGPTFFKL